MNPLQKSSGFMLGTPLVQVKAFEAYRAML